MISVLANRTYRHLLSAQIIALIGTGLATVALGATRGMKQEDIHVIAALALIGGSSRSGPGCGLTLSPASTLRRSTERSRTWRQCAMSFHA